MRLVACPSCHTQYDVTDLADERFECHCGSVVQNRVLRGFDAAVARCASCGAIASPRASGCDYCGASIEIDEARLSLICPECYARNRDDTRYCTACGVAFDPQPVGGEQDRPPCPCCACEMPARRVGGIGVHECPKCNGLWVPEARFETLVARAIEARREAPPERIARLMRPRVTGANPAGQRVAYRKCPGCNAFMRRMNFRKTSGVIVDVCRDCGTWLDRDELECIAGFILSDARRQASEVMRREDAGAERAYQEARVVQPAASRGAGLGLGKPLAGRFGSTAPSSLLGFLMDLLT